MGQLQEERMPGRLNAYPAHSSYTAIGQKGADGDLLFFPSWCAAKLLQSCQTLCATIDCSPPGSSVYGILYARIPEWVARLSSRGTSPLNDQFSSVQFSRSVMSDSFRPHELQHARPPCPSPTPSAYSNSRPSSWWCYPAISSSVVPSSSCPQSLPASGSFPVSQLFAWGGQSTGVSSSASVLPMNTQDWSLLGWTGWISLQSKGLSRVFSNTTVQKHQVFGAQLSSQSNSYIHTWPLEKP